MSPMQLMTIDSFLWKFLQHGLEAGLVDCGDVWTYSHFAVFLYATQ